MNDHADPAKTFNQATDLDHDLVHSELFGIFAVVNGLIDKDTLDEARRQWESDKSTSLAEILVSTGGLSDQERTAIDRLVEIRLGKHGEDSVASFDQILAETISMVASPSVTTTAPLSPSARGSFPVGDFADYEIREQIGEGGMGVVYKARQKTLKRLVALKMIRSGELADEKQVIRFQAEAEAAAKLDHPGIVPVFEIGESNGQNYYSMAFVEGQSLHARIRDNGPLASNEAAGLLKAVAEAVQFAHDNGVIHRDIKPQNILLDENQNPRVTDFGLAKQLQSDRGLTATGQVVGTPSYMSPEQASGKSDEADATTDVYALGATLYFVLTGRPPFQAASTVDTIRQVIEDEPVAPRRLNRAIPRDLDTICLKCLRKDADRRYAKASLLEADLQRWLSGEAIHARPVGRIEKAVLWCKRHPSIAGAAAAILLTVCAVAIVLYSSRQRNLATRVQTAVGSLTSRRGVILPQLDSFDALPREMVLEQLRSQFPLAEQARQPIVACALAHFGDVRIDFLVSQIQATMPDDLDNIVTALGASSIESVAALEAAARTAASDQDWRGEARLAMAAFHLGAPSRAQDMCRLRSDPIRRTWFIEECSSWHGDVSRLVEVVQRTDDDQLYSAVALLLGSTSPTAVTVEQRADWEPVLTSWSQSSDSHLHSSATWALRQWGLDVPEVEISSVPSDRNWQVNSVGMTLHKIPAGSFMRSAYARSKRFDQKVLVSRGFWMADTEVTWEQFEQFIDDPSYPDTEKPTSVPKSDVVSPSNKHPAEFLNWYSAVLFCNWLSRQEELTACYRRTGEKESFSGLEFESWELIDEATGYRLPTEAEWEYACRAGTTTAFVHGDDESLLHRYAVYREPETALPRSKLPNIWGLFDLPGNVSEWCHDWSSQIDRYGVKVSVTDPLGMTWGRIRVNRGGACHSSSEWLESGRYSGSAPNGGSQHSGFRAVRDISGQHPPRAPSSERYLVANPRLASIDPALSALETAPQDIPNLQQSGVLITTQRGVVFFDHSGRGDIFKIFGWRNDVRANIDRRGNEILIYFRGIVHFYDPSGIRRKSIELSTELEHVIDFAALPDGGFALMDNAVDKVAITDAMGRQTRIVALTDTPGSDLQNMYGRVVDGMLYVCDNGTRQISKIDLNSYEVTTVADLGAGLSAFDYFQDQFYLAHSGDVYTRDPNGKRTQIAKLPWRVSGLVVGEDRMYGLDYLRGDLFRYQLSDKKAVLVEGNLVRPNDLILLDAIRPNNN